MLTTVTVMPLSTLLLLLAPYAEGTTDLDALNAPRKRRIKHSAALIDHKPSIR